MKPRRGPGWAALAAAAVAVAAVPAAAQDPAAPVTPEAPPAEVTHSGIVLGTNAEGLILARLDGRKTTVHMLGVGDAGRDAGGRAGCLRDRQADFIGGLLRRGTKITVVTGADARDKRGRLQGWVYKAGRSGAASVNRAVVSAGWAPVPRTGGQLKFEGELRQAEARARRGKLGRWGAACGLSTISGIQKRLIELGYLPAGYTNGSLDYRTQQAVMAFQGWSGLPRAGTVDATTKKRLGSATRPVPWNRSKGKRIEVHIDKQVLLLVDSGTVKRAIHVSTGAGGRTPRGRFSIIRREIRSWSRPFSVTLPYAQYFHGGFAFHEYPSVPGYPASHGCVRLPYPEAPVVWEFGDYGMPVTVA